MQIVIDIPDDDYKKLVNPYQHNEKWCERLKRIVMNGTPLTPAVLADALMEERIRGRLYSNTIFEKDIIEDVKCRLTVSIRDHRPCYCGAELREVWRESEDA